jgi:mannose-6-phosphate isomerase
MTAASGSERHGSAGARRPGVVALPANQPRRFYRGGDAIAAFRGDPPTDGWRPEDWVGSTTALYGAAVTGLTRLDSGVLLRDAVRADPDGWLGPEHVNRFGADPALLVKLLDAGQRLPVHCHPDDAFAAAHLRSPYGKTEAWAILAAAGGATVHIGFRRDVGAAELAELVAAQDADALLSLLVALPVTTGDTVLVPAGAPHAIGAGILLLELQQPTDLSVLLERAGFDAGDPAVGLGEVALDCVDRTGWDAARVTGVRGRVDAPAALPAAADPYFRLDRRRGGDALEPGFAVVVVTDGTGSLGIGGSDWSLSRGRTLLVPYAAGPGRIDGDVTVLRCRPPGRRPPGCRLPEGAP